MAYSKIFRRYVRGLIPLAALVFCACAQLPEYCGDGQSSFDTKNQFCYGGTAYWKCGGSTYDPIHYKCNDNGQIVSKTDTMPTNVTPPVTPPVTPTTYAVTVSSAGTGATGGGSYEAGETVTIKAGTAPTGQQFKNWTTASSGVTLTNANSATTTFTMPKNAVTITANFEAATVTPPITPPVTPPVTPNTYLVTVSSAGTNHSGTGSYEAGVTVTISAGTAPSGQKFKNWTTTSSGVTLINANNATTTFTMPKNAVTVTAVFEQVIFAVTVSAGTGATGSGDYEVGTTVTISAGTAPSGQRFKNWTAIGVTLANANNATTTFTMPKNTVTVAAVFEQLPSYVTFTDSRDNQNYNAVKISNQTWMAENLNYETGNSWCYDDDNSMCNKYGRFYDWNTAMTACPAGWRLPDTADWNRMVEAAGGYVSAGSKLKSTNGWLQNGNGSDAYGFSARPGGVREKSGFFHSTDGSGDWWTATETEAGDAPKWMIAAYYRYMSYLNDTVYEGASQKELGLSVRCVQD